MRNMTREQARQIYFSRYWLQPRLDQINEACPEIAAKLFDIGVNQGPATGVKYLQRALNVLNEGAQDYPNLAVDGGVGQLTLYALHQFLAKRGNEGERVLLNMIRAQQTVSYIEIAERDPTQEMFELGWQAARALI
jgi:lysozyme family protein